jgi:hypothetical protein
LWTIVFGNISSDYRVIVLAFGLLLTAAGVWLRWNDHQTMYLGTRAPAARLFLGCLFGLIVLAATWLFVYSFFYSSIHLRSGPLALVWITTAPASFFAARRCFTLRTGDERPVEIDAEKSFVFVVAAGICLLGSFTLYRSADVTDWDSIRMVLRVLTSVCLLAAAFVLLTTGLRRLFVSVLFVVHFMGIANATLAAPPAPWLVSQSYLRVFRPYLEFMYLTNAYHFYAPEPGPTSYLWFRLIYKDAEGNAHGWWYKVPQIDEKGRIKHTVALEYQRFLSMTETIAPRDNTPAPFFVDIDGVAKPSPIFQRRRDMQPGATIMLGGKKPVGNFPRIPYHPELQEVAQINIPQDGPRRLLQSFARHLARQYEVHPDNPALTFESVKIYRVIHVIPPIFFLMNGIAPTDPQLYNAYYVGNYDRTGKLVQDHDPYLWWLLPTLRDHPLDPDSAIKDYARLHAGDPNWVRARGETTWSERVIPRGGIEP